MLRILGNIDILKCSASLEKKYFESTHVKTIASLKRNSKLEAYIQKVIQVVETVEPKTLFIYTHMFYFTHTQIHIDTRVISK